MIIVEFELSSPILHEALSAAPEMVITTEEESVATGEVRLLFWARGGDFDAFEAALGDDPTVVDYRQLAESDGRRLYRVRLAEAGEEVTIYPTWIALDGLVLSAMATKDGWELRIQFPDRSAVSELREHCRDRGMAFQMKRLYSRHDAEGPGDDFGLTDPQREVLREAVVAGYFDIPRGATLSELGDRLGISGQAASERLRRGMQTLVDNAIGADSDRREQ